MRITVSVLSPPRIKQTSLEKLLGISLPVHVRASNFFSFTEKPRGIFFLPFPSPASISCETSPASRTSIPSVRRKYCNAPAKISTTRKVCVRIKPTPRSVKRARRKTDAEIFSTANAPTPAPPIRGIIPKERQPQLSKYLACTAETPTDRASRVPRKMSSTA